MPLTRMTTIDASADRALSPVVDALDCPSHRLHRTLPSDAVAHRAGWLSTTAFASSSTAMASACGCSGDTGRTGPTRCRRIADAMLALPVTSVTLDGEGVVCDDRGVTDFERLRSVLRGAGPGILLSAHIDDADGPTVFQQVCAMGLEGIIAKRRDRSYRSGRSADWVKIKNPDAPAATRIMGGSDGPLAPDAEDNCVRPQRPRANIALLPSLGDRLTEWRCAAVERTALARPQSD